MNSKISFATLDKAKGVDPLLPQQGEEMPLPAWYRSVYYTPVDELSIEDLCKAARQGLHVEVIIPLVIRRLREDPLAGEMFDGELLASLRNAGLDYWQAHPDEARELKPILESVLKNGPEDLLPDARELWRAIS